MSAKYAAIRRGIFFGAWVERELETAMEFMHNETDKMARYWPKFIAPNEWRVIDLFDSVYYKETFTQKDDAVRKARSLNKAWQATLLPQSSSQTETPKVK